ncbi:outer membrane beta-barrel protein [Thalassomonas haliotis]|uniref:Outer membrane beta-barrel protein n=1 Tax=Thalassomonas haliotis TaxID=485448 RepID=A0ABY7VHT4_9GAMM|nr:outer membrane beta-barrel protein [Thalassomonas haliotis]WDE12789.1 outer membrane beta-barrel protein [Thalassomonas haliotis]
MNKSLAAIIFLVMPGVNAMAQGEGSHRSESGVVITPELQSGYQYDDNLYNRSADEQGSSVFVFAPSGNFLLEDGVNRYALDVGISSGHYLGQSDDDYLDGDIVFSGHFEPDSLQRLNLQVGANWRSEARGTGITEARHDLIDSPLRYFEQQAGLSYEYGALSSKAQLAFELGYLDKSYNNYQDITKYYDYSALLTGAKVFFTTHHRSQLFVELNRNTIRYEHLDNSGKSRDSDDYNLLTGFRWQATAVTAGRVILGYQLKDFTDQQRDNFNGLSWDVSLDWQPLTYTKVSIETQRKAKEPNVEGDYILASLYGLSWSHHWNDVLTTSVSGSYGEEDYQGVSRTDETRTLALSLDYRMSRWADVSLFGQMSDKDSSRRDIQFDKHLVGLNFVFSL